MGGIQATLRSRNVLMTGELFGCQVGISVPKTKSLAFKLHRRAMVPPSSGKPGRKATVC